MDSCGEVVKSIFCENLCLLHLSLRGQAKYELTLLLHSCADGVFLVSSSAQTWKKKQAKRHVSEYTTLGLHLER